MRDLKSFVLSAMCSSALVLSSCSTPATRVAPVAYVPPSPAAAALAEDTPAPAPGPQVTIGTLTDPCTLGVYDPWWTDHGGRVEFHRRCG